MENAQIIFEKIEKIIKQKVNYVSRPYSSVGGMWTVDTWKIGEIEFQLMDEGYTSVILAPGLKAVNGCLRFRFDTGSVVELENVLLSLTK